MDDRQDLGDALRAALAAFGPNPVSRFRRSARLPLSQVEVSATVRSYNCDNPRHPVGCPWGVKLVECPEDEAHTWVASITVNGRNVWSCKAWESESRAAAEAALLKRLAVGVAA